MPRFREIENLTVQNCTVKNMFEKSTYISSRGREENEYFMDRDGFSLLVMGFTGKKALQWKLKYAVFKKVEDCDRGVSISVTPTVNLDHIFSSQDLSKIL